MMPPEKRLEEESRDCGPTDEWECRGEAIGLRTGVEWKDVVAVVFSPSWGKFFALKLF